MVPAGKVKQVWARTARLWRARRQPAWQPVGEGWWMSPVGVLEVHLRREPELGWAVELLDSDAGRRVGRPTFSPRFEDAARVARYLCARYTR